MPLRITKSVKAQRDLLKHFLYIGQDSVTAARRFLKAAERAVENLVALAINKCPKLAQLIFELPPMLKSGDRHRSYPMRGRKPHPLAVGRADLTRLQRIARSLCSPWYQVRRARIILARADGQRTRDIAQQVHCDVRTVRRTCHRFEDFGLSGLLARAKRAGRPVQISPLQRAKIVQLACLEPVAEGLHITH